MAQYISKDALLAEIKKRRDAALTRQKNLEAIGQVTVLDEMIAFELNRIISYIDTIEVKIMNGEKVPMATMNEEPVSEEQVKEDTMTIRKEWFEHCRKSWYNEGYIDGTHNRDRQFKAVSEELEEAANEALNNVLNTHEIVNVRSCLEMFKFGSNWKEQQFEKERLKHCDELTKEQAQIESDFVTQHLKKHNRTPTFIDAIEYGKRLQKEQMMAKAIDGEVGYWNLRGLSINVKLPRSVSEGDKVKVLVVEED